jgi:putative oxidoreductase
MSLSSIQEARPTLKDLARDGGLLLLRLLVGGTMVFAHGLPKLLSYTEKMETFPDPLGVGTGISLALTIFAEVFCAAAILLGLVTRFAAVGLTITMLVAFFVVHGGDPFAKRELAMMYAAGSLVLLLTGAGRLSLDQLLFAGRSRGSLRLDV